MMKIQDNFILMHAMGANTAGQLGSVIAGGILSGNCLEIDLIVLAERFNRVQSLTMPDV